MKYLLVLSVIVSLFCHSCISQSSNPSTSKILNKCPFVGFEFTQVKQTDSISSSITVLDTLISTLQGDLQRLENTSGSIENNFLIGFERLRNRTTINEVKLGNADEIISVQRTVKSICGLVHLLENTSIYNEAEERTEAVRILTDLVQSLGNAKTSLIQDSDGIGDATIQSRAPLIITNNQSGGTNQVNLSNVKNTKITRIHVKQLNKQITNNSAEVNTISQDTIYQSYFVIHYELGDNVRTLGVIHERDKYTDIDFGPILVGYQSSPRVINQKYASVSIYPVTEKEQHLRVTSRSPIDNILDGIHLTVNGEAYKGEVLIIE